MVVFLRRAIAKVDSLLIPQLKVELGRVFRGAKNITVYDCYRGYSRNQHDKVVLAVEVHGATDYHNHVVKLGKCKIVENDYLGWRRCVLKHQVASRMFVYVTRKKLPKDRLAIIYQDARTMYRPDPAAQIAENLEKVASWAIRDDGPDPVSVERVIREIYSDLAVWFYVDSREDEKKARAFFKRRLRRALALWDSDPWRVTLRRELIWLLCGHRAPNAEETPLYLDPYDYVSWALEEPQRLPATLVGRSHGDLHGRNILVGVQRGEAHSPAIFDYGNMDNKNVLMWDFAKLETELKVRLLLPLFKDKEARDTLLERYRERLEQEIPSSEDTPSADQLEESLRVERLAFAAEFEMVLAELTARIGTLVGTQEPGPPSGRRITGNHKIDRALAILLRIRQEAALWLGDKLPQHEHWLLWRDEYYFCLAVYGVCSAKFDYKHFETEFALVSAGVAAARIDAAVEEIHRQIASGPAVSASTSRGPRRRYPCYHVPLAQAHRLWKTGRNVDVAVELLADAAKHFGHAVPLLQEYALLLAETGKHEQALGLIQPFRELCKVFFDEETLSRIGRLCKDLGDRALEHHPVKVLEMGDGPAKQWYKTAYDAYAEAFGLRKNYYPGVNAATLAFLQGQDKTGQDVAKEVLSVCSRIGLGGLAQEERFWVLASEGEASLIVRQGKKAAGFYAEALSVLHPDQAGMAQSAYKQVCRLCWALNDVGVGDTAKPVLDVFRRSSFRLKAGPMRKCGLDKHALGCAAAPKRRAKKGRATPPHARAVPRKPGRRGHPRRTRS